MTPNAQACVIVFQTLDRKVDASWEDYAVEQVLKALRPDDAYYWATHNGAEIDLLLFKNGRRIGVECKRAVRLGVPSSARPPRQDRQGLSDEGTRPADQEKQMVASLAVAV